MTSNNDNFSYRIGRRAGKQGPRPSAGNQAEVEKYATGTNSAHQANEDHHAEDTPHRGPQNAPTKNRQRERRNQWTREEYMEVMEAYFKALSKPNASVTTDAYNIWRTQNPNKRPNMDPNKLANTRRDIINKKRVTDMEIQAIKDKVIDKSDCIENNSRHEDNPSAEAEDDDLPVENDEVDTQNNAQEQLSDSRVTEAQQHTNDEDVATMMEDILRKWEIVKETDVTKRPPIPKIKHTRQAKKALETANEAIKLIKAKKDQKLSLTEVNELFYSSALVVSDTLGIKARSKPQKKPKVPMWKRQIEKDIQKIRGEISILSEILKGSSVKERKRRALARKYKIKSNDDILPVIEKLKQQLLAKSQRIRRLEKRRMFYHQNKMFKENTKRFHRELGKKTTEIHEPPGKEVLENFWASIWEKEKRHNERAEWIKQIENENQQAPTQEWMEISVAETTSAIKKSSNWKAPVIDGIANFWIKHLTALHEDLTNAYNICIENPEECPNWLTTGITHLLPKTEDTANPKSYRPITCLPTIYKILTSILSARCYSHLINNNLLPSERMQKRELWL